MSALPAAPHARGRVHTCERYPGSTAPARHTTDTRALAVVPVVLKARIQTRSAGLTLRPSYARRTTPLAGQVGRRTLRPTRPRQTGSQPRSPTSTGCCTWNRRTDPSSKRSTSRGSTAFPGAGPRYATSSAASSRSRRRIASGRVQIAGRAMSGYAPLVAAMAGSGSPCPVRSSTGRARLPPETHSSWIPAQPVDRRGGGV